MAQDKYLKAHQEGLEKLRSEIRDRKSEILDNIDIDKMMMEPKPYLMRLAKEFYESNEDKFRKAQDMGKSLSKKILKGSSNGRG